ncbi:hypothetical protein EJ063_00415 [Vibrio aquaticus]|uniref:Uncharacterized protein n=1 Tax=Vibrio aquaticus TaxID=2496559 RepID=A0A432D056_9VIBR|nr:hypothetical protein [Vibrio aquaticus]RTZ17279.1 hypothetical protein EJ063_00415 [Vibrio aquaticus]
MNLWGLLPSALVSEFGLTFLPCLAIIGYLMVIGLYVKRKYIRNKVILFLAITLIANTIIFVTLGPGMSGVLVPSLLIAIPALPIYWLLHLWRQNSTKEATAYVLVFVAGLMHCLAWWVWIIALMRS